MCFSPQYLCVFKWVWKLYGCICLTYLHCVFSNESSNRLYKKMHCHKGCIFYFCPLRVFNVFWNCLLEKKQSHTDWICLNFLHCVFSNESSNCMFGKMHSYTNCICSTFLHCCIFKWAFKSHIWEDASHTGCIHWICIHSLHCHTGCFCLTFSYCAFSNDSSKHLFDNMHSHTSCIFLLLFLLLHSHSNCSCKIVMLAAFVGHLFPFCVYKWVLKSPA